MQHDARDSTGIIGDLEFDYYTKRRWVRADAPARRAIVNGLPLENP